MPLQIDLLLTESLFFLCLSPSLFAKYSISEN